MNSLEVRTRLVDALELDLVGPRDGLGDLSEGLSQPPSRWYLTGFLVPIDADIEQRAEPDEADEVDSAGEPRGLDDALQPEPASARQKFLSSAIGVSILLSDSTNELSVTLRWGDYRRTKADDEHGAQGQWQREPRESKVTVPLPQATDKPEENAVPESGGLRLAVSVRSAGGDGCDGGLAKGTRSVSVFLVNARTPKPDEIRDEAFAFQAQMEITTAEPIVPRPNLRSLGSRDWDERVADLQYRDVGEYAVGHSVATAAVVQNGACRTVQTCWIPRAEVERVAPTEIAGVELSMDVLAELKDGEDAKAKLGNFVRQYRAWIERERANVAGLSPRRKEVAEELVNRSSLAAERIESGIRLLADEKCLEAFRIANRAMAHAARQRMGVMLKKDPASVRPAWRPFQLAFLLMNLRGIAEPTHYDRSVVDLLFFPTGGGKTEAYLGLAAFTLVLRRLQNPGIGSAGLSVLMRYTLRLLTLDQLGRAATLICALELERQQDAVKLGDWPFEIGLWVGRAATPNEMGKKGDGKEGTARQRTIAFKNDDTKPSPIPLEECPWCGTKFKPTSFQLAPNPDEPNDLRIVCVNRQCAFTRDNPLPVLAVDEPIYRRLPCFLIATVDKFAAMPWTGPVGAFFGRVERHDADGFYGPCQPRSGRPLPQERLLPPDLVIQDELHLISGPLGTMAGLYETALDKLCERQVDGKAIGTKIVASTATVRRAENQIRAIFNRRAVDIFPPPGTNRRDSFFAEVHEPSRSNARMYVGMVAQGRSPKVVMLRSYLALLAAAQKMYSELGGKSQAENAADPYMTLLCYFNSLRELGGTRRVVEDEVGTRLTGYRNRKRVGESQGLFDNRTIAYEVVELTSRVSTDKVADAKRRLQKAFSDKEHVDVALATNMISVGLDISRLGLMVVFGQPKTSAEYIQATSRVGRDPERPGLVVTILNVHKPRDRSHYERFCAYHETFYRSVEATSVTPFSPRALDRGLVGTVVALARQGYAPMTPPRGATEILRERAHLDFVVNTLADRAAATAIGESPDEIERRRLRVKRLVVDLLDDWSHIAEDFSQTGTALQYQVESGSAQRLLYDFLDPELATLPPRRKRFRANRSLRDVEPAVNLWLKTLDGIDVEEES